MIGITGTAKEVISVVMVYGQFIDIAFRDDKIPRYQGETFSLTVSMNAIERIEIEPATGWQKFEPGIWRMTISVRHSGVNGAQSHDWFSGDVKALLELKNSILKNLSTLHINETTDLPKK
jgi:hypothetical protein